MVESHNYQQTQHAVCLLMINVLDQCGTLQRSRVMEDSCEIFFLLLLLPVFPFFSSPLHRHTHTAINQIG